MATLCNKKNCCYIASPFVLRFVTNCYIPSRCYIPCFINAIVSDYECGCVLLWDKEFGKIVLELQADTRRRAGYVKAYQEGGLGKAQEGMPLKAVTSRHNDSSMASLDLAQSSQKVSQEGNSGIPQHQNEAEKQPPENEMFDSL